MTDLSRIGSDDEQGDACWERARQHMLFFRRPCRFTVANVSTVQQLCTYSSINLVVMCTLLRANGHTQTQFLQDEPGVVHTRNPEEQQAAVAAAVREVLRRYRDGEIQMAFCRTKSAAISEARKLLPTVQRNSIATVCPSIQPSSRKRSTKARVHEVQAAGSPVPRKAIVGSFAGCCARAARGHTAAPPRSVMNSRRCISYPKLKTQHRSRLNGRSGRAEIGIITIASVNSQCR